MKLLFELSGEQPELALLELQSVIRAHQPQEPEALGEPSLPIIQTELEPARIGGRLALCHRVNEVIATGDLDSLLETATDLRLDGSVAVRCRKVLASWEERCSEVERRFGEVIAESHHIDLVDPTSLVRVILGRTGYLTVQRHEVDRASFERRKVALRPFFYPISLHPKYARLLVNITGVREGETLLDPFCGTGGVLIEAGLVGADPVGSDLRGDMVEGCRTNLSKFGIDANLFPADVRELRDHIERVDAIATDPPYGRSTTMAGDIEMLYSESFEVLSDILADGGRLSIIVPETRLMELGKEHMELEASHPLRVHKSLTRHFCLFRN